MEAKIYNQNGKESGKLKLPESVFGLSWNGDLVHQVVTSIETSQRTPVAHTRTRGEVRGGGKKPWQQKGTGRARQGDVKSPLYVGGGIVFGPHPRDYSFAMPKKAKRLAMKSILSLKAQNSTMKVVEDFKVESGKTKDLVAVLKNLLPQDKAERTVIVLNDDDAMVKRAGKNIPWLHFLSYNRLRAHDLFYGRTVLVMESAVASLNDYYADK